MNRNLGKLTATLSATENDKVDLLVDRLNANIKPATKLHRNDVYIRCMYIVSEELNSYGGKFPLEELYQIQKLIIDSPVLIGHKKDALPIGRNFYSEIVFKDNCHWVKSYFYWMKSAENANDLQNNIDGGIIKECSIGFTFETPECSICENDIRTCRHEPFSEYTKDGVRQSCYFKYRQIEQVLETSLVYRGAVPNTSISNDLNIQENSKSLNSLIQIDSLDVLSDTTTYLLAPMYNGLQISLMTTQNSISIVYDENRFVSKLLIKKFFKMYPKNLKNQFGQLIGYRGKERCSVDELRSYLRGDTSIVRRVELRLYPSDEILKTDIQNIKVMRFKLADKDTIDELSQSIMTKEGVRIWELDTKSITHEGYLYNPNCTKQHSTEFKNLEYLITTDAKQNLTLSIWNNNKVEHFCVQRFDDAKFKNGFKFITQKITQENRTDVKRTKYNSGRLQIINENKNSWKLEFENHFYHRVVIQPIVLNNKEQYLLFHTN